MLWNSNPLRGGCRPTRGWARLCTSSWSVGRGRECSHPEEAQQADRTTNLTAQPAPRCLEPEEEPSKPVQPWSLPTVIAAEQHGRKDLEYELPSLGSLRLVSSRLQKTGRLAPSSRSNTMEPIAGPATRPVRLRRTSGHVCEPLGPESK